MLQELEELSLISLLEIYLGRLREIYPDMEDIYWLSGESITIYQIKRWLDSVIVYSNADIKLREEILSRF